MDSIAVEGNLNKVIARQSLGVDASNSWAVAKLNMEAEGLERYKSHRSTSSISDS